MNELEILNNKTFEDMVLLLRKKLEETYPKTKIYCNRYRAVHYANVFSDEQLKQIAFVLDEIDLSVKGKSECFYFKVHIFEICIFV